MVYVTGDCHADYRRFGSKTFRDAKTMSRNDTMIILGDFGLWHDTPEERYWLDWLNDRPFTTVWVDGNHENYDRLDSDEFQICDFHGGKAHKIRDNIYHLMRGHIFEFDGKTFWAFGGAQSHDISDGILDRDNYKDDESFKRAVARFRMRNKMFRINHRSWWEQELPSEEEMAFGIKTLAEHGNKVDYIISHCCPQEIATFMGFRTPDKETMYFNEIAHSVQFDDWWFGHYHQDSEIFGKFHCRYWRIERII